METTDNAPFVLAKESKSRGSSSSSWFRFVSFRLGGNRTSQLTWAGRPSKREEKRWLVNGDAIITRHLPVAQSSTLHSALTWQECFIPVASYHSLVPWQRPWVHHYSSFGSFDCRSTLCIFLFTYVLTFEVFVDQHFYLLRTNTCDQSCFTCGSILELI